MRIASVSIDGFGLFHDRFELELPAGVALIIGDNETGKSTILRAIGAILFGLENANEQAACAPHGTSHPRSGGLVIEAGGERYRIGRDFATNHARVEKLGADGRVLFDGSAKPAGRTDEKEAYDDILRRLLGASSSDLFRNSVLVQQDSLQPEMQKVVRQIASGSSSADYVAVLANLKETGEALSMNLPWRRAAARKPRRIELLRARLDEKKRLLSEARTTDATIGESRRRLDTVETSLRDAQRERASLQSWHGALQSFLQAVDEKKRIEKGLAGCRTTLRDIEKLTNERDACREKIEREYSEYGDFPPQAETDIARAAQVRESRLALEERLRRIQQDILPIMRLARVRFSAALIVAGVLIAALGGIYASGILKIAMTVGGCALAAWPLISMLIAMRAQKSARQAQSTEIERQIEDLQTQSMETEKRYPMLSQIGPEDTLGKLCEFRTLSQRQATIEEASRQHPKREDTESQCDSLSNDLILASNRIKELAGAHPRLIDVEREGAIGSAIEKARSDAARVEQRVADLTSERDELKLKLARDEAREIVSQETVEEEIAEAESEMDRLKLRREACLLAVKTLEEAIAEFRSSHLARIEQRSSALLEQITAMPYRVRLDDRLEPLGVEQAGRFFRPEQLSRGLRDQLHFALRLASAEEVFGATHLPLLLDDPFVNFDGDRLSATLQMLDKLAESHQVLLLTHDRSYSDWKRPARILER